MRIRTPKAYAIRYTKFTDNPTPPYRLVYYRWDHKHYLDVQIPCDCDCHNHVTFEHSFGNCCIDRWKTLTKLKFTSI